jgi:hypothetical protein
VGAMTANVSTSASPVRTWVGGTCGAPTALRRIDSTTEMRTKQVIMSSANGSSDSAAIASRRGTGPNPARLTAPSLRPPSRRQGQPARSGRALEDARQHVREPWSGHGRLARQRARVELRERRHGPVAHADEEAPPRGLDDVQRPARLEGTPRQHPDGAGGLPDAPPRQQLQRGPGDQADDAQRDERQGQRTPPHPWHLRRVAHRSASYAHQSKKVNQFSPVDPSQRGSEGG